MDARGRLVINRKRLEDWTGLHYTTWYRMEKAGKAPSRVRLSAGRVGWIAEDVLNWLASRETV